MKKVSQNIKKIILSWKLLKKKLLFNKNQINIMKKISLMNEKEIILIQGPPGTGKTHLILGIVSALNVNKKNKKILITAPSNSAVDVIYNRINEKGLYDSNLNLYKIKVLRYKSDYNDNLKKNNNQVKSKEESKIFEKTNKNNYM